MINITRYGTTAENNAWVLDKGVVTQDVEAGALRVHDGLTPGGWVCAGTPAEIPAPGPTTLVAGDTTAGFYGEVGSTELIDDATLSEILGLTAGTLVSPNTPWLKFVLDNTTLFMAKKYLRNDLVWYDLNNVGAVYGNTEITIGAHRFKVRLLSGAGSNPSDPDPLNGSDVAPGYGSEWNRLVYRVLATQPPSQTGSNWASYTEDDLGGVNLQTLCWEDHGGKGSAYSVVRLLPDTYGYAPKGGVLMVVNEHGVRCSS